MTQSEITIKNVEYDELGSFFVTLTVQWWSAMTINIVCAQEEWPLLISVPVSLC